ncbi:MAG: helix-turn-helix domain-containing protein [Clostridia bacterium]
MFIFRIKEIRNCKNMTISELSTLTGICQSYLTQLENNKKDNPSLKIMNKIAYALNVKIDDLFYSDLDIKKLKKNSIVKLTNLDYTAKKV